jgi:hypothetical protein
MKSYDMRNFVGRICSECMVWTSVTRTVQGLKYINMCFQEEAGMLEFFSLGENQLWIDFTPALEAKDELNCLYQLGTGFLV